MNSPRYNVEEARRLAVRIFDVRSVVIGVLSLGTVGGTFAGFGTGTPGLGIAALVGGLLAMASVYFTLGWLQCTLLLLSDLAAKSLSVDEAAEPEPDSSPSQSPA